MSTEGSREVSSAERAEFNEIRESFWVDRDLGIPSTELVESRFHLATIPDNASKRLIEAGRARSNEEFRRWLSWYEEKIRTELRRELGLEESDHVAIDKQSDSTSVADIYAQSPFSPILQEALNHRAGDATSEDFKRGYSAALMVSEIRGAAALERFGIPDWEYGWRSFFPNGDEYEWLATHSREDAEQQIRDYQEEEDREYQDKSGEGRLTYSLWRRRKSKAGAWERVEDSSDGE